MVRYCTWAFLLVLCYPITALAIVIGGPVTNPLNGHRYLLLAPKGWVASEEEAVLLGGHLATIRNQAENDFVFQTFGAFGGAPRSLWIGLNDVASEGQVVWVSGEPVTFLPWAAGQPDNCCGGEHYVHIEPPLTCWPAPGQWNDISERSNGVLETCGFGASRGVPISGVVELEGAATALVAAILPTSRSVQVGRAATAFATMINVGSSPARHCGLSPLTSLPVLFVFQATDPTTNQPVGTANTPVDIPAGAMQSFVFAFTPTEAIASTDVALLFHCANSDPPPRISGVNTLLFSASVSPIPDIIALASTLTNDGIVHIPGATGIGVFAVATVNVGAAGAVTATVDTGGANVPVSLTLCETDPGTGACLALPTGSVTTQIEANATPTFGVFVQGMGTSAFDPATQRIFIRFTDASGVTRGATSVAVRIH